MIQYEITFSKSAIKELESLNNKLIDRIWVKIEQLQKNPRPLGCLKLQGSNKLWRIRIGNYRILYSISEAESIIDIISIKNRKDIYK
ncbi:MAG: mRNA interferase RelE/StbE [Bacteroidota bacterium]|nr:mRNA interferase RelE/StbE [Bacteroidota bacterium]